MHDRKMGLNRRKEIEGGRCYSILGAAALLLCTILLSLSSFYFSNYSWEKSFDVYVFLNIAEQMHNGLMPYKDMFDHKGPFFYLIYYVGTCVSGYKGLFLMQVLANFVTFVFVYKTSCLFTARSKASVVVVLILGAFFIFGVTDNSTKPEMWTFPFISSSVYFFYDYFKNDKWSYLRVFFVGFGLGCCLMMKASLVVTWAVFGIYLIVDSIRSQKVPQFIKMLGIVLVGVAFAVVPCIIWLIVNGSFDAFVECYLIFNIFEYSSNDNTNTASNFLQMISNAFVFLALLLHLWLCLKERSRLGWLSFASFVISLLFTSFGSDYFSLVMGLVSSFSLIWFFSTALNDFSFRSSTFFTIALMYFMLIVMTPVMFEQLRFDVNQIVYRAPLSEQSTYKNSECQEVVEYINQNSSKDDPISVQGNKLNLIYCVTGRKPASRYIYLADTLMATHKGADEEFAADIIAKKAKYIVLSSQFTNDKNDKCGIAASKSKQALLDNYRHVQGIAGNQIILWERKTEI